MAGNARFHDKLHRKNHHTLPTVGYPDSANDPIASPSEPFQGDFVVNGQLSASSGISILSAHVQYDLDCENAYIRDTTYTNFISGYGTETIISDGALTGYGDKTLTMDYRKAIYAKTPAFNITGYVSAMSALFVDDAATCNSLTVKTKAIINGNIGIGTNTPNERLTIDGNISFIGTSAHYIKNSNNALLLFGGTTTGDNSYLIHPVYSLSGITGSLSANSSFDVILPYQERKFVYGVENVTRNFLINGIPDFPVAVSDGNILAGLRGFAYSGDAKFNTFDIGGNASIDLKAAGDQSTSNGGGMITFTTMPMNSGTLISALERMRIDSEGQVGIGTSNTVSISSQGRALHVYNNANTGTVHSNSVVAAESNNRNSYFLNYIGGSAQQGGIQVIDSSNKNLVYGKLYINGVGTMRLIPGTGSTDRMTILSGGNVGIGESNPNQKLTVNGSISSNGSVYIDDVLTIGNYTTTNTNSPSATLRFVSYRGENFIESGETSNNDSSAPLVFSTMMGNTEWARFDKDGKFGIGTDTPSEKLHVVGNVLITGNLSALGDTTQIDTTIVTTSAMVIDMSGSATALRITQRGTGNVLLVEDEASDSSAFVINSAGNVGIGVNTPNSKLHINGSITIPYDKYLNFSENGDGHTSIKRNGADNGLEFFTNSSSRMFISDSGNVGIGTKSQLHAPNDKLEVAGNVGAYGYRAKQGKPDGNPLTDASGNGYAFGDDGDTGIFSPLNNGESVGQGIGKVGIYCNGIETSRTFLSNSIPIFTIGGLSASWEAYGRTTSSVYDFINGGLIEFSDGQGGRGIIYRDAFTDTLTIEGRSSNCGVVIASKGLGDVTMGVSANNNGIVLTNNANVGINTASPGAKLHVLGGANTMLIESSSQETVIDFKNTSTTGRQWRLGTGGSSGGLSNGVFGLYDVTAQKMRIMVNSNGDMAIGDSVAGDRLSVRLDQNSPTRITCNNQNTGSLGEAALRLAAYGGYWDIVAGSTDKNTNALTFSITDVEKVRIYSNGNVGIGTLAGTGNRAVYSDASGTLTNTSSDATLKTSVSAISQGLDDVLLLNPVSFNWKNTEKLGTQREIGFIAQEVKEIVPEVIGTNADDTLSLDYPKMIAVLTKAIQELNAKVDAQAAEIAALKNKK